MADKPGSWREQRETPADVQGSAAVVIAVRTGGQRAPILRTPDDIADDTVNNRQQQPFKTKALRISAPWCLNCLLA